ncbi:uncharacterized protein PHACADRAFT_254772 [Phanerochaete carnosa HHB-10118-sp]|uniref:Uncharacterized protein n=1 Tax=Phanerochaete carnosa (strain HHB-10118-sp) TaxID=650164 RepID=K5WDR4_PHACS|nr:uncharacterized protein PHACADRAFT_254772 [Phanerochaete carnosa HHB-10118-sp]EKM57184.1 hypothetical protein PHACADRAFT_254772 [Phanerochaete carnosa HHB-10118-sp]
MYMKEPGDREVVIFRGPEDLMEEPPTTHVVMPSVAETAETADSPDPSVDMSRVQSRDYAEMPESPHDMPLLSGDDSRADMSPAIGPDMDNSRARLINMTPRTDGSRPSIDTLPTTEENASSHPNPQTPDPRGQAPPYFEVVALDDMSPAATPEIPPQTPEPPAEPVESTRRRSGIFGLFHSRHPSRPHVAPTELAPSVSHRRNGSAGSNISTPTVPRPRSRAHSRAGTHRPSQSGSGFSMMSRSRSRLLESPHLTSPSMISVNSISAPLTHTTVRTEFTYPRSGPTADQIKLIASRDSFARFGVPYGEDAIAFHASTSRMDLPPDFEEITGPSRSPILDGNDTTVVEEEAAEGSAHEEEHTQQQSSPLASEPVNATEPSELASPVAAVATDGAKPENNSETVQSPATLAPPPGLGSASTEASASNQAKAKTPPLAIRPPSRASSLNSFATADESIHSAATASPTPFASTSSKASISRLQLPAEGAATSSTATLSTAAPSTISSSSTPRIPTASLHENPDTTSATLSPTTPMTALTDVGRAL